MRELPVGRGPDPVVDRLELSAGHPSAAGHAEVRIALSGDLHALVALLGKQFAEHGIGLDMPAIEDAISGLLTHPERGFILVAARGPMIMGLAVVPLVWTVEHGGLSAWLDELYVVVHERGQGIGRRLVVAALSAARERGCLAMDLEVEPGHERAEELYSRLGFTRSYRHRWARRLAALAPSASVATTDRLRNGQSRDRSMEDAEL